MKELTLTVHACRRSRQRGIDAKAIHHILDFGRDYAAGDGCTAYFLGRRTVNYWRQRKGLRLDCWQDMAVILAPDGAVVTDEHIFGSVPTNWRARS